MALLQLFQRDPVTGLRFLPNSALNHLPGDSVWGRLSHVRRAWGDILQFQKDMYEKYGPIYRSDVVGAQYVSLLGTEANQLGLMDPDRLFSSRLGWFLAIGDLFDGGLMLMDFDEHRAHRRIMQSAFKPAAMVGYLERMNTQMAADIASWQAMPNVGMYPLIKRQSLQLAASVLFDIDLRNDTGAFERALQHLVDAAIVWNRIPLLGRAYARGRNARRYLADYFSQLIEIRRQSPGADVLSRFCEAEDENGARFTDNQIVDHAIFLIMAAHDTIASALTTVIWALANDPEIQDAVREECERYAPEGPASRDLLELRLTERVIKEALRLYAPLPVLVRRAVQTFEFGGYEIPQNAVVCFGISFTHHMPQLWTEPDKFDPNRFCGSVARPPSAFAYLPFGGGAHKCIGMHFAFMQAKAFLVAFLHRYRVALPPDYILKMNLTPIARPRDTLPVTLTPL